MPLSFRQRILALCFPEGDVWSALAYMAHLRAFLVPLKMAGVFEDVL